MPCRMQSTRALCFREAREAIAFASAKSKVYYDSKPKPLFLNEGDRVLLRLNKGYHLPEKPNPKLLNRYAGSSLIKRHVGRLAYELDLAVDWKV